MKRLILAALALAGAVAGIGWCSAPANAQAASAADPCARGPCKLTGAAVRVTIPLPLAGRFAGKFELVPLFDAGHRPVLNNGHTFYALRNPVAFRMADGTLLTAPAGMVTDLASIPRVVTNIMPPDGPWAEAAVMHDDCYRTLGSFRWVWRPPKVGEARSFAGLDGPPFDRARCDELLRQGMVALGVGAVKRVTIYEAVRLGGASGFGH